MKTTQIIEALLFASDAPLSVEDLVRGEEDLDVDAVRQAVAELRAEYEAQGRAFQIYDIAGGYQLLTRPEFSPHLDRFETVPRSTRLRGASLEVLAIIAYRQPIGRSEVEEIRGVGSAHVLRTLQDLALIDVVGRGESLGRPLLYGTTQRFLDHFGFASLEDLPRPDELPVVLTERRRSTGEAPGWAGVESGAADDARPVDEAERESNGERAGDMEPQSEAAVAWDDGRDPSAGRTPDP
jgi:segregation and condensation protein B